MKYKFYFRKSSFKKDKKNANIFIQLIKKYKPKNFLEIGVLEGVTARNVCELMNQYYGNSFKYIGVDLFGIDREKNNLNEHTPISYKFSNPLKYIYFNIILQHHPNDIKGVRYLLKKFRSSIELHKGYSQKILKKIDISKINFCFLDGGHSYETVKSDLSILIKRLPQGSQILIDDYNQESYGVKKAVDEIKNNFIHKIIGRFILIEL